MPGSPISASRRATCLAALSNQNLVTPAGSIDTHGPQVQVRLDGALDDLQKIKDTPIVAGGRTLKLSDIADVKRGYRRARDLPDPQPGRAARSNSAW